LYDPATGRWLSKDPIGISGGLNLYAFCGNDPVNYVDPSGLWGIQFGRRNLGVGDPWLAFDDDSWGDVGRGAAATLDGMIPGFDPFESIYADECGNVDSAYQFSRGAGAFSRDMLLTAATMGGTTSATSGRAIVARSCFTEDTEITTEDGLKPIREIQVGDKVLSWNENTDSVCLGTVVSLFQDTVDEIYSLQIGGHTVETTAEHPFWVVGQGWVTVKNLRPGMKMRGVDDNWIAVSEVRRRIERTRVYNIEVVGTHTYFVSTAQILVHNKAAGFIPPTTLQTGGRTLSNSTLEALKLTKEQGKTAIEALKKGIRNDSHGKILSNGDVIGKGGKWLGNLYDYVP
jgi:hypothetical protein